MYDDGDEEDFESDDIDKYLVKNDDSVGGKKKRGKKKYECNATYIIGDKCWYKLSSRHW